MEKLNSYSQTQEDKQEVTESEQKTQEDKQEIAESEQKTQEIKQEQTVTNENNLDEKIHIYEKEFPTINNVKELIDSIQNMQKYQIYIKKRLDRIKSRGLNDSTIITIKYN
jgi:cobalamin biosynthesis protein CobT